ncbi:UNVERIFIED_CONTAM: hypothetical protein HDU68_005941, partial [Siphonaria sp. JEL0065]
PTNCNPPPDAPRNRNQQSPAAIHALKKPKTSHSTIIKYFAKAVDNPNFAATLLHWRQLPVTYHQRLEALPFLKSCQPAPPLWKVQEPTHKDKDNEADDNYGGSAM